MQTWQTRFGASHTQPPYLLVRKGALSYVYKHISVQLHWGGGVIRRPVLGGDAFSPAPGFQSPILKNESSLQVVQP
jgi:hypothetical protein